MKMAFSRTITVLFILSILLAGGLPAQTAAASGPKSPDPQSAATPGAAAALEALRETSKVDLLTFHPANSVGINGAIGGGIFTVNTANDSNTIGDAELSLREATLISNGTLVGPFSAAERAQISGCTFDAGGSITNLCAGANNTIQFIPTLTQVNINGRLPLTAAPNLIITGQVNSGRLILNSTAADLGFWIGSNNVEVAHFSIINTSLPIGVVSNLALKMLKFHDNYLGLTPAMSSCAGLARIPDFGVIFFMGSGTGAPGDASAYVYGNVIGCAKYDGVNPSNLAYVSIGQDQNGFTSRNWIGVTPAGLPIPNGGAGVSICCTNLEHNIQVIGNTIAYNNDNGILLTYVSTNLIQGNDIHHNGLAGIKNISSTLSSMVNNTIHENGSSGIWLSWDGSSGSPGSGNSIIGGKYYRNGAAGITEGQGANTNSWVNISTYANTGLGVDKNDNGLPDSTGGNVITSISPSSGPVTINGTIGGPLVANNNYHIELYRLARDGSGYGEGRAYLGSYDLQSNISNDTTWHINDQNGHAGCYTSILTVQSLIIPNLNTSYEFSANFGTCPSGGKTTGVFRPSNGLLYLKNANTSGFADVAINYGTAGDYPVAGDWDGNGTDTIGIYRNGVFYLRNSNSVGFADLVFAYGTPGDQPVAGDWDGDGVDTIGVFHNGTFLLRNSNSTGSADVSFALGNPGDVGIAGDWNGDGFDTTGVFRPSNGVIFLKNANTSGFADVALNYGLAGDKPVTGDWDFDGMDTIGVYRNATFLLRNSNTVGFANLVFALGNPGDVPIAGNWDGLP